ncbi:MAG: fimbrillin family protein [Bacteroidaceae bacterium]|nr:fimbrillin family protein [Bacteroidaceae bacterium]
MKKNYFMLAAATMMLAACAETELVNEVNTVAEPQAIGFETFANKATRAENSSALYSWELHAHHESFDVWGYKSVSDNFVFTDEVVTYTTDWGYTGLVYWDKAASSYEFYAAAPSSAIWEINSNVATNHADDYFTVSNYEVNPNNAAKAGSHVYENSFDGVTGAEDLMIASPKNVPSSEFGQKVQLNFNHILSRFNVTVSKDATLTSQTVVMKSLVFYNINHHGTFKENTVPTPPATLAGGTHERWTLNNVTTTYAALTEEVLAVAPASPAVPEYMLQSLVMPQLAAVETVNLDGTSTGLEEPYFTIVYTITDNGNTEEFSASYNLAAAFGITGTGKLAFNEGWQNTLNINIKPAAISFTGNVALWANPTPTPGLEIE